MLSLEKTMPMLGLAPTDLGTFGHFGDLTNILTTQVSSSGSLSTLGLDSNMYFLVNGCAGLTSLQCLGLSAGTICCPCYQSFPALPQANVTTIATGHTRQLQASALPCQHDGSIHPAPLPTVMGQLTNGNTLHHLQPTYQHTRLNGASACFLGNQRFRKDFNHTLSNFHPKGLKRKSDDTLSTDSGDSLNGKSEGSTGSGEEFIQPLYCKVCRVTLNAAAQAKQHFEGKSHAKKVKLTGTNSNNSETNARSSPSATTQDEQDPDSPKEAATTHEINPEIYCKICGVSFNSTKQAKQHYQGKSHAKRVRVTDGDKGRSSQRRGFRYRCFLCNLQLGSKELLSLHFRSLHHQEKLKAQVGSTALISSVFR